MAQDESKSAPPMTISVHLAASSPLNPSPSVKINLQPAITDLQLLINTINAAADMQLNLSLPLDHSPISTPTLMSLNRNTETHREAAEEAGVAFPIDPAFVHVQMPLPPAVVAVESPVPLSIDSLTWSLLVARCARYSNIASRISEVCNLLNETQLACIFQNAQDTLAVIVCGSFVRPWNCLSLSAPLDVDLSVFIPSHYESTIEVHLRALKFLRQCSLIESRRSERSLYLIRASNTASLNHTLGPWFGQLLQLETESPMILLKAEKIRKRRHLMQQLVEMHRASRDLHHIAMLPVFESFVQSINSVSSVDWICNASANGLSPMFDVSGEPF
jgi:hypothetical protein